MLDVKCKRKVGQHSALHMISIVLTASVFILERELLLPFIP